MITIGRDRNDNIVIRVNDGKVVLESDVEVLEMFAEMIIDEMNDMQTERSFMLEEVDL